MLVLVAHGSRDPAGARAITALAREVRRRIDPVGVRVAYADVRAPSVTDVLAEAAWDGEGAVVVPAFLGSGYHVRADIPAQIAASGHDRALLAAPVGPAPELVGVLLDRLAAVGYRAGDRVVLAAAGSSDPRALASTHDMAYLLATRLGTPVRIGYAATARPPIAELVRQERGRGRVAVASWLLAPGLFQRALAACEADAVADPLCALPPGGAVDIPSRLVEVIERRYRAACHGAGDHQAPVVAPAASRRLGRMVV
ncbi:sirohydrochlorin chelatase [Haloechinothrix sp. LS1_15]|uniref:sirohydrochlorin chelatase n=1 Tax=Haloechinothrix sp. LS1_15 TaxID=2652248 RepID=UPI00294717D2|nr:sirohydrochlorin chelatase [Haloechinothrix sp. LS1_15]MDV6013849.1 sirohydrochlorin chelatase [Haloechinothrix sp. LS1_15]